MTLLLDTHAFLWFVLNDSRLGVEALKKIADAASELLISPACYWEMAIKVSLGKLQVEGDFGEFMEEQIAQNNIHVLPISPRHASVVATLPFHHRDPFDRLIIAQAIVEDIPIASADAQFDAYGIQRIW